MEGRLIVGGATGHRSPNDFYETPPEAVDALLRVETFTGPIWEPACGLLSISKRLEDKGHQVVSTDLVDRPGGGEGGVDFLTQSALRAPNIITNPPFKLGLPFVKKALELGADKTALLLRLLWLEGQKRSRFFLEHPPTRVHVISWRLPMMHAQGYEGKKINASILAYAWFVWDRRAEIGNGTTLNWISKE